MSLYIEKLMMAGRPDTLYHYASTDSVLGICQSKKIWASSIHYLNDSSEYKHAIDVMATEITNQKTRNKSTSGEYFDKLHNSLKRIQDLDVFVASFSANGDILSQWRAYCPTDGGFSLGFDPRKLAKSARQQGYTLAPCIYNEQEQFQVVQEMFETLHSMYSNDWGEKSAEFTETFDLLAAMMAPSLKHPSFSEEQEWRVATSPILPQSEIPIKYRAGKTLFIPYKEFSLMDEKGELELEEAIVGPSKHPELSKKSLKSTIITLGVKCKCVNNSKSPLRDW